MSAVPLNLTGPVILKSFRCGSLVSDSIGSNDFGYS
jgi:hypothetical protein